MPHECKCTPPEEHRLAQDYAVRAGTLTQGSSMVIPVPDCPSCGGKRAIRYTKEA